MALRLIYFIAKQRSFAILCSSYILSIVHLSTSQMYTDGLCARRFTGHMVAMCQLFRSSRLTNGYDYFQLYCCNGYKETQRFDNSPICQPICKQPCIRGKCIKPDTCECGKGHFLKSKYECSPMCHPSCKNGNCSGVNDCYCLSGYKMKNDSTHECEPVCEPSCVNGDCSAPGVCECWKGYKVSNTSNRVCNPVCNPPCNNSICTAPGVCQCLIGFERETNNSCLPSCPKGCGEGICKSPGVCECPDERYVLSEITGQCIPKCVADCVNGICISPDKCKCNDGYRLEEGKCRPICTMSCVNSTCIAPEVCKCAVGFERVDNTTCRPVCSEGCGPGTCISPGHCICPHGYTAAPGQSCRPACKSCENGYCVEPETCICKSGYTLDKSGTGKCLLTCDKPCVNATCVFPNICECHEGYIKATDMVCSPKCSSCINGVCIEPETCSCNAGFTVHPEDPLICLPEAEQESYIDPLFSHNFLFPDVIGELNDNLTYFFRNTPILSIPTSCSNLYQMDTTPSEIQNFTLFPCLVTNENNTELQIECKLSLNNTKPYFDEEPLNSPYLDNISSIIKTPKNLNLLLSFPYKYSRDIEDVCTVCIYTTNDYRYFSKNRNLSLKMQSCNDESEGDGLKLFFEEISSPLLIGILVGSICLSLIGVIVIWRTLRSNKVLQISNPGAEDDYL